MSNKKLNLFRISLMIFYMVLNVEAMDSTRFFEKHYNQIKDETLKDISEKSFFENCATQLSGENMNFGKKRSSYGAIHKGYQILG